ncbi:hypothetical protein SBA3_4310003 [Candidatus Sulfopaludibacter sp. SbA3]|nr:hypothetical protein SBA3_4310003 [Candidatus Sulfopaludibacter sp. SbA3]
MGGHSAPSVPDFSPQVGLSSLIRAAPVGSRATRRGPLRRGHESKGLTTRNLQVKMIYSDESAVAFRQALIEIAAGPGCTTGF